MFETRIRSVIFTVATALTVYGIETPIVAILYENVVIALQQHLPFTVLKLSPMTYNNEYCYSLLQQHLPFTVLKRYDSGFHVSPTILVRVATALTVYGIETQKFLGKDREYGKRCNSTYRLRY